MKGVIFSPRLLEQSTSCSTLSSLHLCSKQRSAVHPTPQEKQTGYFNFVNLTCKQHDRAKSPTSAAVPRAPFAWRCKEKTLHARGRHSVDVYRMYWNGRRERNKYPKNV